MKKFFVRITTLVMAVFTMAIMVALPVTAFAAEANNGEVYIAQALADDGDYAIVQLGNPADGGGADAGAGAGAGAGGGHTGKSGSSDADSAYQSVIDFIITWVRRIGAAVAFFGAIMLALALKKNDADQKEDGIKTMVAGFVVWAICFAVDKFDLFT